MKRRERFPFVAADGDIDDELAIEVVLEVPGSRDDARSIPFADRLSGALTGDWEEVIESCGLAFE